MSTGQLQSTAATSTSSNAAATVSTGTSLSPSTSGSATATASLALPLILLSSTRSHSGSSTGSAGSVDRAKEFRKMHKLQISGSGSSAGSGPSAEDISPKGHGRFNADTTSFAGQQKNSLEAGVELTDAADEDTPKWLEQQAQRAASRAQSAARRQQQQSDGFRSPLSSKNDLEETFSNLHPQDKRIFSKLKQTLLSGQKDTPRRPGDSNRAGRNTEEEDDSPTDKAAFASLALPRQAISATEPRRFVSIPPEFADTSRATGGVTSTAAAGTDPAPSADTRAAGDQKGVAPTQQGVAPTQQGVAPPEADHVDDDNASIASTVPDNSNQSHVNRFCPCLECFLPGCIVDIIELTMECIGNFFCCIFCCLCRCCGSERSATRLDSAMYDEESPVPAAVHPAAPTAESKGDELPASALARASALHAVSPSVTTLD